MIHRNIAEKLKGALGDTPVVMIQGARQTGKTTLARGFCEGGGRRYLTLDDPTVFSAASRGAEEFVRGLEGLVVIDEIQRAPGLFKAIKMAVDRDRRPGRFLLTGSANAMLVPKMSESLAGRMELLTLFPFSQGEIGGRRERFVDILFTERFEYSPAEVKGKDLYERMARGGYPEPLTRQTEERRAAWHASYLTTILQRDIRDMAQIEGLSEMPRLLGLLASRIGGLLNFSDLSRSLSMPQSTLKRYFALLEATFLVMLIPAWSSNQGLRLTKMPKIMMVDTGLTCHLLGLDSARLKTDGYLRGAVLENFVAMEVMKQTQWSERRLRVFHYRTTQGKEVDLVLEDAQGHLVGVEVKSAMEIGMAEFDGLRSLRESAGGKFQRGIILYNGTELIAYDHNLMAVPMEALWTM